MALLGRNGMGKTTSLLAITGLNPARSGTVLFKGTDIAREQPFRIARMGIGYSPEGRQLFATLTVLQNLRIPFINKHKDRSRWQHELEAVFTLFPVLRERSRQTAGSLSGGEQQMVAIARAMVGGDEFLLFDEPTEGIAPAVVDMIVEAVAELKRQGRTMLVIEQNPNTAFAVADRVYVLEKGRVVLESQAASLARSPELLERYLGVATAEEAAA